MGGGGPASPVLHPWLISCATGWRFWSCTLHVMAAFHAYLHHPIGTSGTLLKLKPLVQAPHQYVGLHVHFSRSPPSKALGLLIAQGVSHTLWSLHAFQEEHFQLAQVSAAYANAFPNQGCQDKCAVQEFGSASVALTRAKQNHSSWGKRPCTA